MNFSRAVKACLQKTGLNQSEVATRLGVSRMSISHWTSGRHRPDAESIWQLCKLSGVDVREFYEMAS